MALLLRTVTNPKWVAPDWLPAGEVPAEALTDLRANNNALSVWSVESDRANLNMVLAAIASHRDRLDKLDYTLVDEAILPPIAMEWVKSEANTPHPLANASAHRDLIRLTVQKVARLAHEMMPLERVRVSERQIKRILVEALDSGVLDRARMKPGLLSEVQSTSS